MAQRKQKLVSRGTAIQMERRFVGLCLDICLFGAEVVGSPAMFRSCWYGNDRLNAYGLIRLSFSEEIVGQRRI